MVCLGGRMTQVGEPPLAGSKILPVSGAVSGPEMPPGLEVGPFTCVRATK